MKFTELDRIPKMIIYYLKKTYFSLRNQSLKNISGLIISIVFFAFLSYYAILLYNAFRFAVFDLGLSYRLEYLFITTHSLVNWPIPHVLVSASPYTTLIYVPLSLTLLIYNSPVTVLVTQVGLIAIGGYAIFRIFKNITNNYLFGIIMQLVYFMYIPTYGFLTHGGNFEVYFEPLFLISYMYYIEKKFTLSFISIAFAAITNRWAPILLILFYSLQIVLDKHILGKLFFKKNRKSSILKYISKSINRGSKEKYFFIAVFLFSISIFIMEVMIYTLPALISGSRINLSSEYSTSMLSNSLISIFGNMIDLKMSFLTQTFFPFLAIPLCTPYAILIVPYFILSWYSNYPSYYYLLQQYPYLFVGFLFVSIAYYFKILKSKKLIKKLVTLIFIFTLIEFTLFSPFNLQGLENGSFSSSIYVNNIEKELNYGFSLIPSNSTIFIQNNFPQLMYCEKVYMPGYYNNQTVDYAVIDPVSYNGISAAFSGYSSYWANEFAHNRSYGIY
ncbi:MAG: DUF2079 domain-containing protein, partial [Candidatus Micrarchaeaceae archaeon]